MISNVFCPQSLGRPRPQARPHSLPRHAVDVCVIYDNSSVNSGVFFYNSTWRLGRLFGQMAKVGL